MTARWTQEDIDRLNAQRSKLPAHVPVKSKYRNVRIVVDGDTFDSKREAQYWVELNLREKAGEITGLARQVHYDLKCPIDNILSKELDAVVSQYIADFQFFDRSGKFHVQDVKGGQATKTSIYKLKKKWLELQSGIVIEEV